MKTNRQYKAAKSPGSSHRRLNKWLDNEIESVTVKLVKEVSGIEAWQRTYEVISSVPGIGDGVAYTLLGELP